MNENPNLHPRSSGTYVAQSDTPKNSTESEIEVLEEEVQYVGSMISIF